MNIEKAKCPLCKRIYQSQCSFSEEDLIDHAILDIGVLFKIEQALKQVGVL